MGWSLLLCPILCLTFLFFPFPSYSSLNPLCNPYESFALLQFSNSFSINQNISYSDNIVKYPKTVSWKNGTDFCSWDGVLCDSISGHVIGLNLSSSCLQGPLHSNSTLFVSCLFFLLKSSEADSIFPALVTSLFSPSGFLCFSPFSFVFPCFLCYSQFY